MNAPTVATELSKLSNIHALNNQLLLDISQSTNAMRQDLAALQQNMAVMHLSLIQVTNCSARNQNRSSYLTEPLAPLLDAAGAVPLGLMQPMSADDINSLTGAEVDILLNAYLLDVAGTVAARKLRLLQFLGRR